MSYEWMARKTNRLRPQCESTGSELRAGAETQAWDEASTQLELRLHRIWLWIESVREQRKSSVERHIPFLLSIGSDFWSENTISERISIRNDSKMLSFDAFIVLNHFLLLLRLLHEVFRKMFYRFSRHKLIALRNVLEAKIYNSFVLNGRPMKGSFKQKLYFIFLDLSRFSYFNTLKVFH